MAEINLQSLTFDLHRLTRRGKFRKVVRETYLRHDIRCGISECELCYGDVAAADKCPPWEQQPSLSSGRKLVVVDPAVLKCHADWLLNCQALENVVLPQSALEEVKRSKPEVYKHLRDWMRAEKTSGEGLQAPLKMYVFPDRFCRGLIDDPVLKRKRATSSMLETTAQASRWYKDHSGNEVLILSGLEDSEKKAWAYHSPSLEGVEVMTVLEFVESVKTEFPDAGEKLAMQSPDSDVSPGSSGDGPYPPHLRLAAISEGLKSRSLVQGRLKMARGSCRRGFVSAQGGAEVEIKGRIHLNRALDGDLVALEILSDRDEVVDNPVEAEDLDVHDSSLDNQERKVGRVVGILKRPARDYAGSLQPSMDPSNSGKGDASKLERLFIPVDPRVPWIRLQTRLSSDLENKRFLVRIDSWDRHSMNPRGHWTRVLGEIGERATESAVILHEHGVVSREFSEAVLKCLPPPDYTPSAEEIARRMDMRDKVVCSVDPPGCKDIDDALMCERLPNGNFRVGVHIADVTHFVSPDSPIDVEAQKRCTTVYLVEKRTDMLPGLLTTHLCSLIANQDRLCFSVLWTITPQGEVLENETVFGKGVIRSRAALSYADAQSRIDNPEDRSELTEGLRNLNGLAKLIREKRVEAGALELSGQEVRFEFDSETMDPTEVSEYTLRDTNRMVEEFMLLANQSVAKQILGSFPTSSVLRCHPSPKEQSLKSLQSLLVNKGIVDFKFGSNKELAESLARCVKPGDAYFNKLVRMLTTRAMNQAVYFCTGDLPREQFSHYGLAMDLYTHFTSPIRRYADVLVHRLLAASIGLCPLPDQLLERTRVAEQCETINQRHKMAQFSGRASVDLHTYLYFKKKGPAETDAVVCRVSKSDIQVSVPRYGVDGKCRMDSDVWEWNSELECLKHSATGTVISVFDHVRVMIEACDDNFRLSTVMSFLQVSEKTSSEQLLLQEKDFQEIQLEMFPDRITRDGE